jgi:hypothetical protein
LSSIVEITDVEAFLNQFDKDIKKAVRQRINTLDEVPFYLVSITGNDVTKNAAVYTMFEWLLDNVQHKVVKQYPHARLGYTAVSAMGYYFFKHHSDALAFYFRFGNEYE